MQGENMPDRAFFKRLLAGIVLPVLLLGCSPSNHAQSASPPPAAQAAVPGVQLPDFTALVKREGPAVVNISTTQTLRSRGFPFAMPPDMSPDDPFYEFFRRFMPPPGSPQTYQSQSLGSGFIISEDGYILTNAHVIDGADEVTVKLTDKRTFKAKIIGSDKRTDVALIKISASGLPKVDIGNPASLQPGEWVVAIGSPFGFDSSVTAGIVSALGRSLPDENYVPFIQTDVAINPGNSGGPLFNMKGTVVGINSQIYSRTGGYMGLSFAIPIDVAMDVVGQLKAHGKVSRGRLGIGIQDVSQDLADSFGLAKASGALVASVDKGGPADKGGMEVGDVILKYDGKNVESSTELPRLVAATKPGTSVTVQVWRKGKTRNLSMTVGEMPTERMAAQDNGGGNPLGLVLRDLSAEQRKQLGVKEGVLVADAQGAAARAGIVQGDVILALNNTPVTGAAQFEKLLQGYSKGQTVALLVRRHGNALYVPLKIE
jgi:serine protease Do